MKTYADLKHWSAAALLLYLYVYLNMCIVQLSGDQQQSLYTLVCSFLAALSFCSPVHVQLSGDQQQGLYSLV